MNVFGKILLASNSPRRRDLLSEAGFDIEIVKADGLEEIYPENIKTDAIPEFLSQLKADACRDYVKIYNLPLVAADTIVILDDVPIGKPADFSDAQVMLRKLSGRTHRVITGVTLITPENGTVTFSENTDVTFGKLTLEMIDFYLSNYRPLDKAGSYGVQEWIGLIGVERIDGDYYNIMGFPVHRFIQTYLSLFPKKFLH